MGDSNIVHANFSGFYNSSFKGGSPFLSDSHHTATVIDRSFSTYILPVQVGIGIIGNIFSLAVFNTQRLGQFSVGFYLFVYCIVSLLLCSFFGYTWVCGMLRATEIDIYSDTSCKLWHLVFRVLLHSEAWIIVAASLDRFIMMFYPERAVSFCQVFMSKVAITSIFIGMIVINVHTLWTFGVRNDLCQIHREDLFTIIWMWMAATCNTYLPSTLLLVVVSFLLFGVCRPRPSMRSNSLRNTEPLDFNTLVLVLSHLYLLFTLPSTITDIIPKVVPNEYLHQPTFTEKMYLYMVIFNVLIPLPSIFVFPTSAIFSSTFRLELKACCSSTVRRMGRPHGHSELRTTESGTSDTLVVHSHSNDTLL